MEHKVDFGNIEWTVPAQGVKFKAFISGSQKIRIVEFSEGLTEPDWCRNGHSGYILDGECKISFNEEIECFEKGDVIHIPDG